MSGLCPLPICIEWLTCTHTYARYGHNEPSKRLNDSLANKYVCQAGHKKERMKRNLPKNVSKRIWSPSFPSLPIPSPPHLCWLIHSPVTNSTPTRSQLLVLCQFGALQIWPFFCLMTHHAAPLGFGLRLTMHANDGICCQGGERAGGALGRQRRRFFYFGGKNSDTFFSSSPSYFFWVTLAAH